MVSSREHTLHVQGHNSGLSLHFADIGLTVTVTCMLPCLGQAGLGHNWHDSSPVAPPKIFLMLFVEQEVEVMKC